MLFHTAANTWFFFTIPDKDSMLLLINNIDNVRVSSRKEVKDGHVIFKFKCNNHKRVGISLENAIFIVESDNTVLIKPSRHCDNIKRYMSFENKILSLVNTPGLKNSLGSVEIHKDYGHVIRCKLKDTLSDITSLGHLVNAELFLTQCVNTTKRTTMTWEIASIERASCSTQDDLLSTLGTPFDTDEDEDHGPPPEELEKAKQETITKLEDHVEQLVKDFKSLDKRIKMCNNFLIQLKGPSETVHMLETIIKANSALDGV